jgi:hypothetical protein
MIVVGPNKKWAEAVLTLIIGKILSDWAMATVWLL